LFFAASAAKIMPMAGVHLRICGDIGASGAAHIGRLMKKTQVKPRDAKSIAARITVQVIFLGIFAEGSQCRETVCGRQNKTHGRDTRRLIEGAGYGCEETTASARNGLVVRGWARG
jgi:hypothetical protein